MTMSNQQDHGDGVHEEELEVMQNLNSIRDEMIEKVVTKYASVLNKRISKMVKKAKGDMSVQQTQALQEVQLEHIREFDQILKDKFDKVVEEDEFQDILNEIFETSSQLSEEGDWLEEMYPRSEAAAKKAGDMKTAADETYGTLAKQVEEMTMHVQEEEYKVKGLEKAIFKQIDRAPRPTPMLSVSENRQNTSVKESIK